MTLPHNPHTSWFAESMIKVTKGVLTCTKYPQWHSQPLLPSCCSMPADFHLPWTTDPLYQYTLNTTMPQYLWPTDPHVLDVQDHLNKCTGNKYTHDSKGSYEKAPLYSGHLSLYCIMPRSCGLVQLSYGIVSTTCISSLYFLLWCIPDDMHSPQTVPRDHVMSSPELPTAPSNASPPCCINSTM